MAKLTLATVTGNGAVTLNANFTSIVTAIENTLSRDGTTPNQMEADFDMNSNHIINLPTPTSNAHAATKEYVDDEIVNALENVVGPDGLASIAAISQDDGQIIVGNGTKWVGESGATARTSLGLTIGTDVQAYSSILSATTASFTTTLESKLSGIEASATADQTGAEIKSLYEAESDTNAFTDTLLSKLNGIESSADVTDATNVAAAGAAMLTGATFTGNVGIGAAPAASLDVRGNAHIGGSVSSTRRVTITNQGIMNLEHGNNALTSVLVFSNSDTSSTTNHGSQMSWSFVDDAGTEVEAGRLGVIKEQQWTSTASTRDAAMLFLLAQDGNVAEKMRLTAAGQLELDGGISAGSLAAKTGHNGSVSGTLTETDHGRGQISEVSSTTTFSSMTSGAHGVVINNTGSAITLQRASGTITLYRNGTSVVSFQIPARGVGRFYYTSTNVVYYSGDVV